MALCGDHKKMIDRLNRIEGQVKGIRKMVAEDRNCFDVLKQIASVNGAMHSLGMLILEEHLKGCVSDTLQANEGGEEMIGQIIEVFHKFNR